MAGFFRVAGHSQTQKEPATAASEASSKKRFTGIHIFGRSRKKSNQSTASIVRAPSSDRRPSLAIQAPPPLPLRPLTKSIGSKPSSHSRLPKPSQPEAARPSVLSASTSRPDSYESGSSTGSWPRSTTHRPLITISLSPDNLLEYKNLFFVPTTQDSYVTPSPTPPTSGHPRRGQTPASAIAAAHRQLTSDGDDRSPSRYSRKNSVSDRDHEETPGPSGIRESSWATADGKKRLPPSLQRHPSRSVQSSENVNSPRKKSNSNPPITPSRSGPPSIPLPQTPVPSASSSDVLLSPLRQTSNTELEATSIQKLIEAHTIGLVGNPPLLDDRPTSNTTATLTPPSQSTDIPSPAKNLDIDTASEPQLRAALRSWNQRCDELDTYVVKITEAHAMEVMNLGKKVHTLEKEVARRDKELKGLRWIINNGDSSVASGSDSVSSFHHKSLHKPSSTLAEVTYNFCHTGSTCRPSKKPPGLGAEKVLGTPNKQPSLTSVSPSPSPSSSTSSLSRLPPSPSITMSSLSSIPEGPPSTLRLSLRYDNSDQEERRALCHRDSAAHRASTSSKASSSTAKSSVYSGNIQCNRPPSIAQVLEKSPIIDDVLEKLHPFA